VLPDVPAIDKVFDYLVPPAMDADVRLGTIVRVPLHGRRVGGWVVVDGPSGDGDERGRALRPLAKVTGWGPPPDVLELADWAAHRWAGRRASLLGTASPPRAVRWLEPRPGSVSARSRPDAAQTGELGALIVGALRPPAAHRVLRLPPSTDPFPVLEAACRLGPALLLLASVADAAWMGQRLRAAGHAVAVHPNEWATARAGGVSVVGARAAAWAPMPELAAVVVVDAHDETYQEERAPTWHARDVAVERARRAGVPAVLVSACPDLVMVAAADRVLAPTKPAERSGWPALHVVDRRHEDPRSGLLSDRLADVLRRSDRALCVLNRKGRAKLLACSACGELARCERCSAAVVLDDDVLACGRCGETRPPLCASCGATRLKALRLGVTRVREELEALIRRPVGEVTAETDEVPDTPILVGTEAVLHRGGRADVVAFLDFDQELLATRYRAAEQALALLARAARLTGGRRRGGSVLVQTRVPDHEVIQAALYGDPTRLAGPELVRRQALGFPPASALAQVSGPAAPELVERLAAQPVDLLGPDAGAWLVRAPDHEVLAAALAAAGRPPGRLRIEVDPLRI
jgi:primosomal protein N' (replication factor Y) (superfamily II helicase)